MPSTLGWLRNPWSFASAHYLITKKGEIHQLVQLDKRSWSSGRISGPSDRAKKIMLKTLAGTYVKPGEYLVQIEFECLLDETFTEEQHRAVLWLCKTFDFTVTKNNFLTHKDTASDKPDLETERTEILKRLAEDPNRVGRDALKEQIINLVQQL